MDVINGLGQSLHDGEAAKTAHPIEKISTGAPGLDQILNGGFPAGRPTLIAGGAGSGKTMLVYSFLRACRERDEAVVVASFEEGPDDLRRHALTIGLDLSVLETDGHLALVDATSTARVDSGTSDVQGTFEDIQSACHRLKARHLVLESFSAFTRTLGEPNLQMQEYLDLRTWSLAHNTTTLVTARADGEGRLLPRTYDEFLPYQIDCHLSLQYEVSNEAAIRRLWVQKYRGSDFRPGRHLFTITSAGFNVAPLIAIDLDKGIDYDCLSTGSRALDAIMGGGFIRGSVNAITGPGGCGKSLATAMMAVAAAERGECVLRLSFEMASGAANHFSRRAGYDVAALEDKGLCKTISVLPESVNSEGLLFALISHMHDDKPGLVIVDDLSAIARFGTTELAQNFVVRLVGAVRAEGISAFLTSTRPLGSRPGLQPHSAHINAQTYSMLFDSNIDFDLAYEDGSMVRRVGVLKQRGANHSTHLHTYTIDAQGFHFHERHPDRLSAT